MPGKSVPDEFAGMGLEVVVEARRYSAFQNKHLAAMISSIPGCFVSTGKHYELPLAFGSGQCMLASCNDKLERICQNNQDFEGFLEALRRAGFRLEKDKPLTPLTIR